MICALCIQTSSAVDIKVSSDINVVGGIKGPLKIGRGLRWDNETLSLFLSTSTSSNPSLLLLLPSSSLSASCCCSHRIRSAHQHHGGAVGSLLVPGSSCTGSFCGWQLVSLGGGLGRGPCLNCMHCSLCSDEDDAGFLCCSLGPSLFLSITCLVCFSRLYFC